MLLSKTFGIALGMEGQLYCMSYNKEPVIKKVEPLDKIWKSTERDTFLAKSKTGQFFMVQYDSRVDINIIKLSNVPTTAEVSNGFVHWIKNGILYFRKVSGYVNTMICKPTPNYIHIINIDSVIFVYENHMVLIRNGHRMNIQKSLDSIIKKTALSENSKELHASILFENSTLWHIHKDILSGIELDEPCIDIFAEDNVHFYVTKQKLYKKTARLPPVEYTDYETPISIFKSMFGHDYIIHENTLTDVYKHGRYGCRRVITFDVPILDMGTCEQIVGMGYDMIVVLLADYSVHKIANHDTEAQRVTFFDENPIYRPVSIKSARKV